LVTSAENWKVLYCFIGPFILWYLNDRDTKLERWSEHSLEKNKLSHGIKSGICREREW